MVLKLKDTYGLWQEFLQHIPKAKRFTLGSKIDCIFLEAIENCFLASYANLFEKIILLDKGISRIDLLKLLLELAWESKALDTKKYSALLERISEIGRMAGGWKRQLLLKTPRVSPQEKLL